jgi:hypothetical protein
MGKTQIQSVSHATYHTFQLRTAYHDMITYRGAERAGGLDGSILFETDRQENVGIGFNNTFLYVTTSHTTKIPLSNIKAIYSQAIAPALAWLTCSQQPLTLPFASAVVLLSTSAQVASMHRVLDLSVLPIQPKLSTFTE